MYQRLRCTRKKVFSFIQVSQSKNTSKVWYLDEASVFAYRYWGFTFRHTISKIHSAIRHACGCVKGWQQSLGNCFCYAQQGTCEKQQIILSFQLFFDAFSTLTGPSNFQLNASKFRQQMWAKQTAHNANIRFKHWNIYVLVKIHALQQQSNASKFAKVALKANKLTFNEFQEPTSATYHHSIGGQRIDKRQRWKPSLHAITSQRTQLILHFGMR